VAESPWIKFYTSDFLTGVADLQAEEIGIYTVLLALIWDKGGPIADDAAWLARRSGTSTRKFNQVRARLIELGKLEARNGLLANRRALDEVTKRDGKSAQARNAALTRWKVEGEPELPLNPAAKPVGTKVAPRARARSGDYLPKNGQINGRNSGDKDVLISGKNQQEPQKSAIPGDADACFPSRAGACQISEVRISTQPNPPTEPALSRLDNTDLKALVDAVLDASGFNPVSPGQIDLAWAKVQAWRDAGIDFTEVVVPTILHTIANSSDVTRTLGRFDKAIRHEHARRGAKAATGGAYVAPPSPITSREDEEPVFALIRQQLLERLGVTAYCATANRMKLETVEMGDTDKRRPLRVVEGRGGARFLDGDRTTILRQIAQQHGFTDVW
jgi:uncharacterized protein YdaU (DUF1376 family)